MNGLGRRFALVIVALVVALRAGAADPEPAPAPKGTIGWEQAADHMGEEVTVEGRVVGIHCSPLSCLLAFEPTFNKFTAVVQAASFEKLPPEELKNRYEGRQVRVRGKIVDRDKKPEIVIEDPAALALVKPEDAQAGAAAEASMPERLLRAQMETLERMADVLDRIEELTERIAAVQERMDTVLANMEQRDNALAQAAAAPPAPADGSPQPRPGYEALRSIKRGMAPNEVERLVGPPAYVEQTQNGWTTWYYTGGRSISFDNRGRAQAFVGFAR